MALWGGLSVGNESIATWYAQRLDDLEDVDQVSLYICGYSEPTHLSGVDILVTTTAVIEHRYSDGAAVLARKVLQLAEGGW